MAETTSSSDFIDSLISEDGRTAEMDNNSARDQLQAVLERLFREEPAPESIENLILLRVDSIHDSMDQSDLVDLVDDAVNVGRKYRDTVAFTIDMIGSTIWFAGTAEEALASVQKALGTGQPEPSQRQQKIKK